LLRSNLSALQSSSGQLDEDEITWGSDELPIEDINLKFTEGQSAEPVLHNCSHCNSNACYFSSLSFSDGPIVTEDELTSLPLVKVVPDGHYTSTNLSTIVRMMKGLLEQKVPLQEFEVQKYFIVLYT